VTQHADVAVPRLTPLPGGWLVKSVGGWQIQVRRLRLFRVVEVPEIDTRDAGRYWCYVTFEAAVLAAAAWDGGPDTEPVGWLRKGGARK